MTTRDPRFAELDRRIAAEPSDPKSPEVPRRTASEPPKKRERPLWKPVPWPKRRRAYLRSKRQAVKMQGDPE